MMKRMLKNHLLSSVVILSSVLWGGTVFADNVRNNIESFELDPVLVTATRYETRDLEIPAATEIFDQKKIEKLQRYGSSTQYSWIYPNCFTNR